MFHFDDRCMNALLYPVYDSFIIDQSLTLVSNEVRLLFHQFTRISISEILFGDTLCQ